MAYPSVYKSLLGFSAAVLASGFLFLAVNSQAAPAGAPVITGSVIINPAVPQARQEVVLSLSAGGVSDDKTAAKDLIYFWDFGQEYETALGDSASSPNLGEVKHYFDEPRVYDASLRVIDADGNVSDPKNFTVLVDSIGNPDNANRAMWPLAHITRPGNGPYAVGSVKFSGTLSQPGTATAQIIKDAGFEWHLFDSNRAELTIAGSGPNAVIGRTGNDFTYTFSAPGFYYLTLKTTQINPDFFDYAIFAFEVTSDLSRVASQEFNATIASNKGASLTTTDDAVTETVRFTATVTGGLPGFVYVWNYPPETNEFTQSTVGSMLRTNDTPNILFKSPGIKPIFLRVRDSAWREKLVTFNFEIIAKNYKGTSYSPPSSAPPFTALPLSLSLTPINADLRLVAPTPTTLTGPIAPQVVNFQALASGGLPEYSYSWSSAGRQGVCAQNTCTYSFTSVGDYTVRLAVTDRSSPPQSVVQNRNVIVTIAGTGTPPPSGGTGSGTAGGTSGGSTGGSTGGTAGGTSGGSSGTIVDPSGTNYGLNTSFKDVTIGQSADPKATAAKIINIILGFLGIIAVILGLWGGFQIMTAAGNEEKVASGRQTIVYAVIGLVIVFVAWGIAQFVITSLLSATT